MEHLSLTDLNELIKGTLANHLLPSYWVVAEIGEIRLNANGHCYLELVDKSNGSVSAKSKATIWSYTFRNLNGWFEAITGSPLMQGMRILANVQVAFHEVYGLSLNIRDIDAHFTIGDRERIKRETIAKLMSDGVLEMNKLHELPSVPQRIAVISSATAAGFEDFMHTISSSPYNIYITLFQATMQGNQAAPSIISALHQAAAQEFDLVVIIRGGGAQMDMDAFNDYELCSHIAQFPIPVVTGIGHERDETIADMVAHTRFKTPTAAAEFITSAFEYFHHSLRNQLLNFQSIAYNTVAQHFTQLREVKHELRYSTTALTKGKFQQIERLKLKQVYMAEGYIRHKQAEVHQAAVILKKATATLLSNHSKALVVLRNAIRFSDPQQVLKKGYTITLANGKAIGNNIAELKNGVELTTIAQNGIVYSTINKIEQKNV